MHQWEEDTVVFMGGGEGLWFKQHKHCWPAALSYKSWGGKGFIHA